MLRSRILAMAKIKTDSFLGKCIENTAKLKKGIENIEVIVVSCNNKIRFINITYR